MSEDGELRGLLRPDARDRSRLMVIKKITIEVERTDEGKYEFSGQIIETDFGWTWRTPWKYDSAEDALKNCVDILGTLAVDERFR